MSQTLWAKPETKMDAELLITSKLVMFRLIRGNVSLEVSENDLQKLWQEIGLTQAANVIREKPALLHVMCNKFRGAWQGQA